MHLQDPSIDEDDYVIFSLFLKNPPHDYGPTTGSVVMCRNAKVKYFFQSLGMRKLT